MATATQLWHRGWRVVLADLDGESAERRRAELDDCTDTLAVPADVTDTGAVEAMMAAVTDRFGRLDALVNNAARRCSPARRSPTG